MTIKDLVEKLSIDDYRENNRNYKKYIFENERKMAELVLDWNVGVFVHNYEKCLNDLYCGKKKYSDLSELLDKYKDSYGVQEYLRLRELNDFMLRDMKCYYIKLNKSFRDNLIHVEEEIPNVYVKSEEGFSNIIYKDETDIDNESTLVLPAYDMNSKRDMRHFYNKVSFHYLEGLCQDYSFDLDNKKLGKVLIKKNN